MRRVSMVFLLVAGLLACVGTFVVARGASAQGSSQPTRVDVIKLEGAMDRPSLSYLEERLDSAVSDGAIVVLQMDVPGTMGEDAMALADRLVSLPVPVITWTGSVPARASGAGLLLMYASSLAAVAPGSQTGPLMPIDVLHPDDVPADLDSRIDGWLAARDRQVRREHEDQALTAQQALDLGFAEAAAPSVPDLLNAIDGRTVATAQGPVRLETAIATTDADQGVAIRFVEPGPVQRVQHAVASPSMVYFLLLFGLACLAFEMTQPGFGFAGFAGVGLLFLAAYGIAIVPPSWLGLTLLLASVALAVLDVRLRKLGWFSAAALACLLAGSLLLYGGVADVVRISPWMIVLVVVGSILYYGFGLTVAVQSRDRILSTQRGLIGLVGEARGRLAPDGPVQVKGAMWRGRAIGEPISAGTMVRVRGVEGLILQVEPEVDPEFDYGDGTP